jgi:hypothetical protein
MFSIAYSRTEAGGISTPDSEYCQTTLLLLSKGFCPDGPKSVKFVATTLIAIRALHFAICIDRFVSIVLYYVIFPYTFSFFTG